MATQLFKDGESQYFKTAKVQAALAAGWAVTEEAEAEAAAQAEAEAELAEAKEAVETAEKETAEAEEAVGIANEQIREAAKLAGIENWDTARISTLKKKLGM